MSSLSRETFLWLLVAICCVTFGTLALVWFYLCRNYPAFEEPHGDFKFVGVSRHRVPHSVRFKAFYPSSAEAVARSNAQKAKSYTDPRSFEGLSTYTGLRSFVFSYLNGGNANSPYFEDAPIVAPKNDSSKYPVLVFSHGVCGNWDLYSQLCTHLCSFGLVVFALDFDDGSASFTLSHSKLPMPYIPAHVVDDETGEKRFLGARAKREDSQRFRQPQLRHRVKRVGELLDFLQLASSALTTSTTRDSSTRISQMTDAEFDELRCVLKHCDLSQVILAGHSFGGTTSILYAKQNPSLQLKGVVCYEPWLCPLSDAQLSAPWEVPYYSLVGDEWSAGPLYKHSRAVVDSNLCDNRCMEHVYGMIHTSFCDVLFWYPDFAASILGRQSVAQSLGRAQQSALMIGRTIDFLAQILGDSRVCGRLPYKKELLIDCLNWTKVRKTRYKPGEEH